MAAVRRRRRAVHAARGAPAGRTGAPCVRGAVAAARTGARAAARRVRTRCALSFFVGLFTHTQGHTWRAVACAAHRVRRAARPPAHALPRAAQVFDAFGPGVAAWRAEALPTFAVSAALVAAVVIPLGRHVLDKGFQARAARAVGRRAAAARRSLPTRARGGAARRAGAGALLRGPARSVRCTVAGEYLCDRAHRGVRRDAAATPRISPPGAHARHAHPRRACRAARTRPRPPSQRSRRRRARSRVPSRARAHASLSHRP
jgi:hypothetical protein